MIKYTMRYLFSLLIAFSVVTSYGQMSLTSSNNDGANMCSNERVVLRITNGNLYSDFVWTKYAYKNNEWIIETLNNTLDSLVLENEEPLVYIYNVNAKYNGTDIVSNQKSILVKPSGKFDLIIGNSSVIALDKETICTQSTMRVEYNPAYVTSQHSFKWNTGDDTPYLNITTNGVYNLTVTTGAGQCPIFDEVEIKVLNPKVAAGALNRILCEGSQINLKPTSVPQNSEATLAYNWQNGLGNNNSLQVNTQGNYKLVTSYTTTQNKVCKDSVLYIVTEKENPTISTIPELTASKFPFEINAGKYISTPADFNYVWSTPSNQTVSTQQITSVNEKGEYNLKVTNKTTACSSTATAKVNFVPPLPPPIEEVVEIYIPNVIAPNESDEDNQTLRVYSESLAAENFLFEIYNRWGELVYSTTAIEEAQHIGWNGSKNNSGDLLNQGTYSYKVKGQYTNGIPFDKVGSVTLVR